MQFKYTDREKRYCMTSHKIDWTLSGGSVSNKIAHTFDQTNRPRTHDMSCRQTDWTIDICPIAVGIRLTVP